MPVPAPPPAQPFIDHLRYEKRYSPHTVRAYTDDLAEFFRFLKTVYEVEDLSSIRTVMIRSWMAEMSSVDIGPRSINRKISCLKSFFTFCRVNGHLVSNPAGPLHLLKTKKRLPAYIEEKQMAVLMKDVEFPDDHQGRTEFLMMSLLYQTGIRVSELVGIRRGSVDFYQKALKILGKGNKERIIPLNPELVDLVRSYQQSLNSGEKNHDFLLVHQNGKAFNSRQVYDIVRKWLSLITSAEKKSPHVLRHSFATHLTNNGADLNAVKELLGHTSLAATQVYTHNSIEKLRDIHKKTHPKG